MRDSILGREPGDWDITTSASPQEVKSLFPRTIDTGIEHGTVTVMDGKEGFEMTTYRIDGDYEDQPSSEKRDFYQKPDGGSEAQRFYDQCDGVFAGNGTGG